MSDTRQRYTFVMEQTLGHVTHYQNLRAEVDATPAVQATWLPLSFPPRGTAETLPLLRSNWSARASWRARRALAANGADAEVLFFHTQVTTLLSTGLMRRIPSVISLDATPVNYDAVGQAYGHRRGSRVAEGVKRRINKRSLRAARALVTWCGWARQSLIADYGIDEHLITVIAPGTDLTQWQRKVYDARPDRLNVLFVGGDFQRKGGDILLAALDDDLRNRCHLHLVTKSAPRDLPSDVHVYADLSPNSVELRDLYAKADLFVLPTRADCFPLVIQEAMAAGLPVIATPVGAISESVRDRETGLLVAPGNVADLRGALRALIEQPDWRRAMGREGRKQAEERFDSRRNAQRVLAIMDGIRHSPFPRPEFASSSQVRS